MIYPKNAGSLSLLLGASGVVVSAAATLPCLDAEHTRPRTNTLALEARCGAFEAVRETRRAPRRVAPAPKADGSSAPQDHIVTTKEVSSTEPFAAPSIPGISQLSSLLEPDLNDPLGGAVDWLNPHQIISDIIEGGLDLVAPTEEGPRAQKIGTLGYADAYSGHSPFELWSETETGSLVYLSPVESAQEEMSAPDPGFSNHSMAMIVARTLPLGLLPDLNLTDSGAHSESAHASEASAATGLITIRIKAGASADNSEPKENLCATYYNDWSQNEDWVPMRLQSCDDSYLSGTPSVPRGASETQLWEYDPSTREVKPMLLRVGPEAAAKGDDSSTASTTLRSVDSSTSTSGTATALGSSATVGKDSISLGDTRTRSAEMSMVSQSKVHREGDGNLLAAIRRRDAFVPPFMVVQVVDPYTLIFNPRSATGTGSTTPDLPA